MSATKLERTKCTFQQCIDYVDIVRLGGVKQGWGGENKLYKCVNISKTVAGTAVRPTEIYYY